MAGGVWWRGEVRIFFQCAGAALTMPHHGSCNPFHHMLGFIRKWERIRVLRHHNRSSPCLFPQVRRSGHVLLAPWARFSRWQLFRRCRSRSTRNIRLRYNRA